MTLEPVRWAIGPQADLPEGHAAWSKVRQFHHSARRSPDGLEVLLSWRGARPDEIPESFSDDWTAVSEKLAAWDLAAQAEAASLGAE